jgi:hypothetical protein
MKIKSRTIGRGIFPWILKINIDDLFGGLKDAG